MADATASSDHGLTRMTPLSVREQPMNSEITSAPGLSAD
jgi:hypothetical protein